MQEVMIHFAMLLWPFYNLVQFLIQGFLWEVVVGIGLGIEH